MASHHDPDDPEFAPPRTIVQGTQLQAVEHGHEGTDVNLSSTIKWFTGLLVVTLLTMAFVYGVLVVAHNFNEQASKAPNELLATQQVPPEPRVLPNPAEVPKAGSDALRGPAEDGAEFRAAEVEHMRQYGLANGLGDLEIPPKALEEVTKQGTTTAGTHGMDSQPGASAMPGEGHVPDAAARNSDLLVQPQPTAASGGLAWENRLH